MNICGESWLLCTNAVQHVATTIYTCLSIYIMSNFCRNSDNLLTFSIAQLTPSTPSSAPRIHTAFTLEHRDGVPYSLGKKMALMVVDVPSGGGFCHETMVIFHSFSRERLRRVLRKKAADVIHLQIYIFSPPHLPIYIFSPSHLQI